METIQIAAQKREDRGGGAGRRLRASGSIPAIVYGNKLGSDSIALEAKDFLHKLAHVDGENVLLDITLADQDKSVRVFLKEIQRDPVTDEILHLDLFRIDETREMEFSVPIRQIGNPVGVKEGGILDQPLRSLDIKCLIKDLPGHFEMDVSELGLQDSLHVKDMDIPEGVEVLTPEDEVVFSVLIPRLAVEEEEEEAAEEEMEPEVIGEKKEEEEEEEKAEES